MTKSDVRKVAEQYVLSQKKHYKNVTKEDLKEVVDKVAKALAEMTARPSKEQPTRRTRAKAA
jgi:hypothetical protein